MPVDNLIIIGGGPAAYTAALYAARAGLHPLCIAGREAGGQLAGGGSVENFPGFPEAIVGADLVARCRSQAERFGARFIGRQVTEADLSASPFVLDCDGEERRTRALIVATGASPRTLGIPSEIELAGRGVATCGSTAVPAVAGRRVLVIGGGDAALEEALGSAGSAAEVVVVHRRDTFRATPVMVEYADAHERISFLTPFVVDEFLAGEDDAFRGARLRHAESSETHIEAAAAAIVAIGHEPATTLVRGQVACDADGYIVTEPGRSSTSVPGVFAAGDVQDRTYRQAITSAGSGCMAALDAHRWLTGTASESASGALLRVA